MERNGFLTVILLFLIVSDCSSAFSLRSLIKLIDTAPKDGSPATDFSPLASPNSSSTGTESKVPPLLNDPTKVDTKGSKNDDTNIDSSAQKQIGKEKNNEGKEKTDGKIDSHLDSSGSCKGSINNCSVGEVMIACIQGSKDLVLLVQNEGESTLKVNIAPTSFLKTTDMGKCDILKNHTERIDLTLTVDQSAKIVVHTGNGECELHTGPPPSLNFLQRLPSYYKQVTPIYGAYLLFLIALIVGGTWACCKFTKRRRQDAGVPYQELEMGLPESASVVNVDTAEGWDEGWDDDWDENNAVKSPGGHHVGSISANGLTARSSNRDGWAKDRDD